MEVAPGAVEALRSGEVGEARDGAERERCWNEKHEDRPPLDPAEPSAQPPSRFRTERHAHHLIVAQAYFRIGDKTVEVFGPRAEQIAHLLALDRNDVAKKLADRIGNHVADAQAGEPLLELDDGEERELVAVLDEIADESKEVPGDVRELRSALRSSLGG